ncbi:hypothetical protein SAMN06295905_1183 [Devosia lucknowensis]|uniref:Uncharacterized protein n=1 Tax=Devosia lucknowensis TaxID=1096929 RepID=A0A1Y6EVJ3_9HYPH|nr:hypothetical protein SAMN06295905_1183 [Devosia lucknowensis]
MHLVMAPLFHFGRRLDRALRKADAGTVPVYTLDSPSLCL